MMLIEMMMRRKKTERRKITRRRVSSKGKAKQESSSEDEDLSFDEMDDEKMALFVKRFGKFMMKKGYRAEERSLHPRTRKSQEGASIVEAKIILLANVHTIVRKMMKTRTRRSGKKRKIRRTRCPSKRRRVVHMWSLGIVMLPQVMMMMMMIVMITRPPRRRF